jgi:hypothetical protein
MDRHPYERVRVSPSHADPVDHVWRPVVNLVIWGLSDRFDTKGLLDTGATETLLPMGLWDELEPAHVEGERGILAAANGTEIPVRYGTVDLGIVQGRRRHRWHAKVGFTSSRRDVVLGDAGFFRFFVVTFDRKGRYSTIRPNGELPRPIMPLSWDR